MPPLALKMPCGCIFAAIDCGILNEENRVLVNSMVCPYVYLVLEMIDL